MKFPFQRTLGRVARACAPSSLAAALIALIALLSSPLAAHEVQPSVMNLTIGGAAAEVAVEATLEPMIAGAALDTLTDTNDSDVAGEIDRLRALPPSELEQAFRDYWPQMTEAFGLSVGGEPLDLELTGVEIPETGNVELARVSTFTAEAALPGGAEAVTVRWYGSLGPLVVRQMAPEGAEVSNDALYSGFLQTGGETDPIPAAGVSQSFGAAFLTYIPVGFEHIVPLGLDHILFVLGLFFLSTQLGPLLWQVTAFTAAHTVTLALAALGIVSIPGAVVEPLIAASIVYVGVENVLSRGLSPWRPYVVLAFGLLHGLGFASVLTEYGLGSQNFLAKLIGFNIGVEIGQLAVIAVAFVLVSAAIVARSDDRPKSYAFLLLAFLVAPAAIAAASLMGAVEGVVPLIAAAAILLGFTGAALASDGADSYRQNVANPASILIALVGAYWFVERVFL